LPAQAAAAPVKSSNTAIKVVLIIIAIFVGMGMLGAAIFGFTIWRVARAIHATAANGQMSVQTPGGTLSTHEATNLTASDLGAEIYPGAESTAGGMRMEYPTGSMVSGAFLTSDNKDMVITFYKSEFGGGGSVFVTADGAVLTANKGPQESVVVTVTAKPGENDGKTKIVILHTKSNRAS